LEEKQLKIQFAGIISQNQGILHKISSLYCNDPEEKKDLFQEILYQLWRSYPTFRNESKISTWIYRVALNTAITFLRKQKARPGQDSFTEKIPDIQDDSEQELLDRQFKLLYTSIEKLDKIEKAIIMLYLEGASYEEIADIIGITSNHVGVKLNRIKAKLKSLINFLDDEN
jgi:RNA polymerase sigma factor (sigma-70 family)